MANASAKKQNKLLVRFNVQKMLDRNTPDLRRIRYNP